MTRRYDIIRQAISALLRISPSLRCIGFIGIQGLLYGCGGTGSDGSCPNVAGDFVITQHCTAELVGTSVSLEQDGCGLLFGEPFGSFEGSVSQSGSVALGGIIEGDVINCTGTASSNRIALNCTGSCDVVFARR